MARIGIYGGAFNPIHNGHLHIVLEFIRLLQLDFVLLIPTGVSPHKAAVTGGASAEDRLAMCRLACETEPRIRVSDCEIRRAGKSYTADTITWLQKQYPQDELFLLMGEDMFLTVEKWFDAPRIFRGAVLCAAPRSEDGARRLAEHARFLQEEYPYVKTCVQPISYLDVSSTAVREALQTGASVSAMVPPAVDRYIRDRFLYREETPMLTRKEYEEILRPLLTEKRFYHSCCVANEAVKLARRWGADEKKAEIAGILHDIMKDTPPEKQLKYMQEFGIILSDTQKQTRKVWHQLCGAGYMEHRLGIRDREILQAVRYHTTGRAQMSLLEKVIFTADYISEDRDYDGVKEIRRTAYEDLSKAMLIGLSFTVEELSSKKQPIAEDTFLAYNECCLAALAEE